MGKVTILEEWPILRGIQLYRFCSLKVLHFNDKEWPRGGPQYRGPPLIIYMHLGGGGQASYTFSLSIAC